MGAPLSTQAAPTWRLDRRARLRWSFRARHSSLVLKTFGVLLAGPDAGDYGDKGVKDWGLP
jgi:hypothetical protein